MAGWLHIVLTSLWIVHLNAKGLYSDPIQTSEQTILWQTPEKSDVTPLETNPEVRYMKPLPKGTNENKSFLDTVRMPGTQWCGKGWRTDSFSKLGGYSAADRCCRQHDLGCQISIQAGQTKYGLTNYRFHTVMHCTCDDRFRSCLKMTHILFQV
ncbi:uncharacterized protein LOC111695465 isoform X3 [Eurytemora carolleeae]|uniref:uncharacterized protein LOC111695465 isoform X3 n=1 Tax=Eurytemora carolleeae TaxID=1294199 RepID=UPI000C78D45C|nr:uncharacterized protein LOC111695465 isoform X3 [Eurytemora carolleeae]|eukprot:XP_023320578.1 uncharacterized protein LOC111695465 isoform X3 [Eurytemora affinis]